MDTKLRVDAYAFKTRTLPMIFSAVPLLVIGVLLFPSLWEVPGEPIGGLLGCASLFLLAQLGRDRGRAIEPRLYKEWGGKPSVAMLRHRDSRIDRHTKRRWRVWLESRIPGLVLATAAEEAQCPVKADDGYESATTWLLSQTRDPVRFRLLHAENVSYGFRRNMLGLRPLALGLDVICVVGLSAWMWLRGSFEVDGESGTPDIEVFELWGCLFVTLAHSGFVLGMLRSSWVRTLADEYGRRLLACCDSLAMDGN